LATLGIDSTKDGEVYHNARLSPGKHHYGGWFHFIGTLDEFGDFSPAELSAGLTVQLHHKSAPSLQEFKGLPLVQLEFTASSVPWRLNEAEAN
jgi:hypothetical protein